MHRPVLLSIVTVLLFSVSALHAQDEGFRPVNFKKLKKEIRKKKSDFYYPALFQRYLELDTSLSVEEFRFLYFGFTFQNEYRPYGVPSRQDSLLNYLSRDDLIRAEYAIAGRIGGDLLKENPFRLRETFITALIYELAGNTDLSSRYFNFYEKQVDAIMSSGDGLSTKTAFTVIYVQDEYEILEVLGFEFNGEQHLLQGGYDMLELEENPFGIDALYFDVNRLFDVGFK
ncbi:MAG: DUF4919 domain-containing protein [Bacteroidales bacterium]|jgi:hypothetical protein|nr:DUF4919 domain-containing protein [Bacteroidales bacterium]